VFRPYGPTVDLISREHLLIVTDMNVTSTTSGYVDDSSPTPSLGDATSSSSSSSVADADWQQQVWYMETRMRVVGPVVVVVSGGPPSTVQRRPLTVDVLLRHPAYNSASRRLTLRNRK